MFGRCEKKVFQPATLYGMDGDIADDYFPCEETVSDRDEDVYMGMRPHTKRPREK